MIKTSIYTVLIVFLFFSFSSSDLELLDKNQTQKLFDFMMKDIEQFDSEMIASRNNNKEVSWDTYKKFHSKKWRKKVTSSDLKKLFYSFNKGFVNAHSYYEYLYPEEKKDVDRDLYESNIKIGYTYPEITFFDVATGNQITHINDTPIKEIFWNFDNYETKAIGKNVALSHFKYYFDNQYLKIKGKFPVSITLEKNKKKPIIYNKVTSATNQGNNPNEYKNWNIINEGYKTTLLEKDSIALIKIKDFIYPNGLGDEIDCGNSKVQDSTMCKDVRLLKTGLESISHRTKYLIFDLQGNYGGNENTPFIKMFSPAPFYDLRIQYKKTKLLEDKEIRQALSYYNYQGENWYRKLQENGAYDKTEYGAFLPQRGDFCRGEASCKLVKQMPNDSLTSKFEKIMLLVNEGTASSADDFAYKFKKNNNTYIAGQPQSADLTYALITVLYYLDANGEIQRTYSGNSQEELDVHGTKLFKFEIPYSKTVDKEGNMLQGNPLPLDVLIPITRENFNRREISVLEQAVKYLNKTAASKK